MGLKSVRFGSAAAGLLLAAGLVWASACESNGGTEPPTEESATIQVLVSVDGSGQQGVTVRLFESGGSDALSSQQTGSDGTASFSNLSAGTYDAEVVVPTGLALDEGETAKKSVTVAAGATASVAVELVTEGGTDPDVVEIHLTGSNTFSPSEVTISEGTTVRWINDTSTFHTVTPDGHSQWSRVEMNNEGDIFTHTFNNIGTFEYFCEPHESIGMTGTITVESD